MIDEYINYGYNQVKDLVDVFLAKLPIYQKSVNYAMPYVDELLKLHIQEPEPSSYFFLPPKDLPDVDTKPLLESLVNTVDILETVPISHNILDFFAPD